MLKPLPTFVTAVRLFSTTAELMTFQFIWTQKTLPTLVAAVCFLESAWVNDILNVWTFWNSSHTQHSYEVFLHCKCVDDLFKWLNIPKLFPHSSQLWAYLHRVRVDASYDWIFWNSSHTCCSGGTFLQSDWINDILNHWKIYNSSRTHHCHGAFLQSGWVDVLNGWTVQNSSCTYHRKMFSLQRCWIHPELQHWIPPLSYQVDLIHCGQESVKGTNGESPFKPDPKWRLYQVGGTCQKI